MPKVKDSLPGAVVAGTRAVNLSASALVKTGPGFLSGIFVASSTDGTIKIWNALTATTPVLVNEFAATAGTWYPLPFAFETGCYITLGGTIDCTVSFS